MSKNAAFSRGRPLCWLVLLASGVALLAAFQSTALAYQFGEPEVRAIGPEERVFDWSTQRCSNEDIPDHPARAFKDSLDRVQLIASHASVRRKIGPNLNSVQHQCPIVMDSHGNQDPAAFDDKEWLSSTYTTDGQTIYGLTSTEYHGWEYDEACAPFVNHLKCWYNSITLVKSVNRGDSYTHAPAPAHRVANSPYRYETGNGPLGIFDPSNIVYRPSDGYYYAMVRAEPEGAQQWGACLMRTQDLNDPASWRAWDGAGFGVRFMNPYLENEPPAAHVCTPVSPETLDKPIQTASLTYSTYLGKYVLLGVSQRYDPVAARWNGGFYYSLSEDLINWSPMKIFMEAQMPWTHRCGDPDNPVRDPSLLDPTSTTRSFETIGRTPYLYFTRFNLEYWDPNTCWATLDRDLIRIPIEFTDTSPQNQPPAALFTASPNPVPTGQIVTFNGSASNDPDGSIANYKWDLDGNGSFETDRGTTPTITTSYPTATVVTVRLQVTDNQGAKSETSRVLTVSNRLPTASFTAPTQADAGQVVSFDGSASNDPDGSIAKYEWDLDGDSTFETDSESMPTTSMSYPAAATVTVKLRVTDNNGDTDQTTRNLTVNPPPPTNQLPTASFTASPDPALTGMVVSFDGSASSDPDGSIANYKWDLDGNGSFETNTGTTAAASSSYQSVTTVTVKLRVTDNDLAAGDTSRTLTVNAPPPPPPPPAPTPGPAGPQGPPIGAQSPPAGKCAAARTRRALLTKRLGSARRKLARARSASAKRYYRRVIRVLTRQRKRLQSVGCPR